MSADLRAAIAAANRKFMESFSLGDAAALAGYYTADAQLLPPSSDFVQGPGPIEQFWMGAIQMGIKKADLSTVELEHHGDTAIEIGKYSLSGEGGQSLDHGKYLVVWRNDGGAWKLHRDIWTSSVTPG